MAQSQQGPQQGSQVGLGSEKAYPLVLGLGGDRVRLRNGLADVVLDAPYRRCIASLRAANNSGTDRAARSSIWAAASIARAWARAGNTRSETASAVMLPTTTSTTR
jgi:hypothetical protein